MDELDYCVIVCVLVPRAGWETAKNGQPVVNLRVAKELEIKYFTLVEVGWGCSRMTLSLFARLAEFWFYCWPQRQWCT
jgi:hypothetical protein